MDIFSTEKRSDIMSKIHSGDTKPEMVVRRLLFAMGFRFRLHDRKLPGVPDLVLRKYKTVVFVHGCFWHAHEGCPRATVPKSNEAFWREKLARNKARDEAVRGELLAAGWRVLTIWECACGMARPVEARRFRHRARIHALDTQVGASRFVPGTQNKARRPRVL